MLKMTFPPSLRLNTQLALCIIAVLLNLASFKPQLTAAQTLGSNNEFTVSNLWKSLLNSTEHHNLITTSAENSGVLIYSRDNFGSRLQYHNNDINQISHVKTFSLSTRSFAIGQYLNVVVVADAANNFLTARFGSPSYRMKRSNPRGVVYDGTEEIMMWLEGEGKESEFKTAGFDKQAKLISIREPGLKLEGCQNATLTAAVRLPYEKLIVVPTICNNELYLIKVSTPISIPLVAKVTKATMADHPLSHASAIAAADVNSALHVFVSRSDGRSLCQVERLIVDTKQLDENRIILKRETVLECSRVASSYFIRGLAVGDNYLFISSFSPNGFKDYSNSIGRVVYNYPGVLDFADVHIILDTQNQFSAGSKSPETFSPGPLQIRKMDTGFDLFWSDLLTGSISRVNLAKSNLAPGEITIEPMEGQKCPAAFALLPANKTAGEKFPTLYWSDLGTNLIWKDSLGLNDDWKTTESKFIVKAFGRPTALMIEPNENLLYWTQPEDKRIVAFSLDAKRVIKTLSYALDEDRAPSRFNSIAHLPSTNRIYVADSSPHYKRIISWEAPNATTLPNSVDAVSQGEVVWKANPDSFDFTPKDIVGDPDFNLLYVSDAEAAIIYVMYLDWHEIVKEEPKDTTPDVLTELLLELFPSARTTLGEFNTTETQPKGDNNLRLATRVFYRAPEIETAPIQQMWLNHGLLNWVEARPTVDGLVENTIQFKRLPQSDNPHKGHWDENSSFVYAKSVNQTSILAALMYDVHEGVLPQNARLMAAVALVVIVLVLLVAIGFYVIRRKLNHKNYVDPEEKVKLTSESDRRDESSNDCKPETVNGKKKIGGFKVSMNGYSKV